MTAYDHDELKSMLASYAIGALPEDEMPGIRDHILTCEECMEEADRYAAVAPVLALTTPPAPLPAGFADAVVTKVRAMEPVARTTPKGRRTLLPRLAFGATAVAAIVLAGALMDARNDARQAERSLAALEQRVERNEQALSSLVRDDDGWRLEGSGGAVGRMVPNDGGATLAVAGLPAAPEGHIYQLWLLSDECGDAPCAPTSAGLFEVTSGVVLVDVDRSIATFAGAAVTLEPAGGSALPTTDPLLASV